MLDILLIVIYISIGICFLAGAFLVSQLVWDRFWTVSFPIMVELYARWKYPEQFKDDVR